MPSISEKRKENKVSNSTSFDQTLSAPRVTPGKKWQVSRLTHKRYEIVNLLWRKTKIFGDVQSVTPNPNIKSVPKRKRDHGYSTTQETQKLNYALPYLRRSSSTPSFIEFQYLDLSNDEKNSNSINESDNNAKYNENQVVVNSPFFVFHLQYETCKSTQTPPLQVNNTFRNLFLAYLTSPRNIQNAEDNTENNIDIETCPLTTLPSNTMNSSDDSVEGYNNNNENVTKATTIYDKIKFFEIYDSDTPQISHAQNLDYDQKALFEDVDVKTSMQSNYNKTRFVKKHIDKVISAEYRNEFYKQSSKELFPEAAKATIKSLVDNEYSYISRQAAWSDFPFVAVYVYEPLQVRCDAAAISPHWLLAAASCLSRRNRDTYYVDGQSAYVAYCTDNWRNPERISYVKRSFIHPRFDDRDFARRHLYNIGVLQIVNSMAETCNGWAPVSLISHQFDANPAGSVGVALGWGLDRYDASQPINVKHPLMMYENLVHSETCPGYNDISQMKSSKNKVNDLYCLSLPNYSGENDDKVHGALLLIGGKLIALYLQEERRPSGEQSALYTGVWRHIPWLVDTAREPEEFVTFSLEF
ncbi:unnamed protein product [Colias eurytheme]|nr:unnamed protein product [Colias eurytheme]